MQLIIFTGSPSLKKYFTGIEKSRSWSLEILPHEDLRIKMKNTGSAELYLLDYASLDDEAKQKNLNFILRKSNTASGIIDRKNEIIDPAGILMRGSDYISLSLLKDGIKPDRLNKSIEYHEIRTEKNISRADSEAAAGKPDSGSKPNYIIPEGGWRGVKSGHEYTFLMLFTEISIPAELKKKSGSGHLNKLKQIFQAVIDRETAPHDGRIWIWNEYGGLVLFPFDGESVDAVIPAVKLLLNRVLISVEDFHLHSAINLRAAMHLGTTTYKTRGKTGTIISDSINSIFHLGTKFTPLDDLDITEEVYNLLPERIKELFCETGIFEDRNIFRLRHFEISG